ncbi:retrovirus-related pol polyprotein from transposon TNT 1-94 [Tanacetum coccineum]
MTGNRSKLKNFVEKFIRTVRFGNDHFGAIMGYGDYVIGDSVISRVYYVEGLGHNLLSVGQFCDSDLEIAFRKHSCFVRDMNGVDLLKGSRSTNLYTISLDDMMNSSLVCLLSKASKTKPWLWHRRLNHLNFGTINDLARKDLVRGLPRLKFEKDHLCSACQLGKSKKYSHKPKSENTNMEVLHTLHMDLCGPMRVQSINGKKYILVIVDDYSRFTWVKFLRSKDETPEFVINFLKQIQVGLNKTVRYIRTDNGTEFVNQVMSKYYEGVGIFHQKSVPRTPQQNGVVERRNRTLVEAARTMLIFSKAPMKKQVTFNDKPGTSSSNTQKHEEHQKVQHSNIPVIPSTGVNSSTEASGSKPRCNTKNNRNQPAKSVNQKTIKDHPMTNKSVWTKVNRVDSSISSKRVVINSNSESVCKTCNKCLNSANHEMCVVNILNSVNATSTVKIVLNKGKQIWKPKGKLSDNSLNKTKRVWKATGKLFANVGYQWRPTGKKFSLGKLNCGYLWRPTGKKFALGELCPTTKPPVKCTIISANQQDPNKNWGTKIPNSPHSTVFKCRSYRSSFGIWTQAVQNI